MPETITQPMPSGIPAISPLEAGLSEPTDNTFRGSNMTPPPQPPPGSFPLNPQHQPTPPGTPANPSAPQDDFAKNLDAFKAKQTPPAPAAKPATSATADTKGVDVHGTDDKGQPTLKERLDFTKGKKSSDWKAVHQTIDQKTTQIQQLQAELDKLRGVTPAPAQPVEQDFTKLPANELLSKHPELKKLKEERDAYYEEIKHVRVESDPEFRAKFDTARQAAMNIIKGSAGAAAPEIEKILAIADPELRMNALAERIKDFQEGTRQKIIAANSALTTIDVQKEIEIAQRKATWDSRQQSVAAQRQAQSQERMRQDAETFNRVTERWKRDFPFYQKQEGNQEHNKAVDAALDSAREYYMGNVDADDLVQIAHWAASSQLAIKVAEQANEQIGAWEAWYKSIYGTSPDMGVISGAKNTGQLPATPQSFVEQLDAIKRGGR
jgi:hypothetical protein